jgi:mannitol-1-/sugar-/sorbitol-6-/2-deoxyglucose-6-phosphatase
MPHSSVRLTRHCSEVLAATLFDMDGLLIDSEILWHEAEQDILGALGVPFPEGAPRETKGMFVTEVVAYWRARFPWSAPDTATVTRTILQRVGDLVEEKGRLMPGALDALDAMAERGPLALASSTPTALIDRCLRHFGLQDRFASIHSAEDEQWGKPHPAVFLTAAAALRARPQDCLVFEDSAAGVLAAKAGRMMCVAVPTADDRGQPAFALADLVLASLEDLSPAWLDERFGR